MKTILIIILLTCTFGVAFCQDNKVRLYEYLYPGTKPMKFNCTYNSFHANGLHDTIFLSFKKLDIENEVAYCISQIEDPSCQYSELATFLGSAMIFRNDSILLAPLKWNKPATSIALRDFKYFIPPILALASSISIQLHDRNIKLSNFKFETLTISGKRLNNCLKIRITEKYKNAEKPLYGYVWLDKTYGIIKWIRVTKRTEIRDLTN